VLDGDEFARSLALLELECQFFECPKDVWRFAIEPEAGMLILDIAEERMVGIEILYRDKIRECLLEFCPEILVR
jgi:hypothetical protein